MSEQIAPTSFGVNTAAQYLGISRSSILRLVKEGELQVVKLGGRTLIRRVDADELLTRHAARKPGSKTSQAVT